MKLRSLENAQQTVHRSITTYVTVKGRERTFFSNHSREQRVKTWHATCWACPKIMDGETGSTEHMMCLLLVKPFLKKTWSQCLKITQKKSHFTTFEKKSQFDSFWFLLTYSDSIWLILTNFESFWLFLTIFDYFWLPLTPFDSFDSFWLILTHFN